MKLPSETGAWPLRECLIAEEWRNTFQITQILIARNAPGGRIAMGSFVVDLGCLGVKNAMSHIFESGGEYRAFRNQMTSRQSMVPCALDLAAKVIEEAIAYARDLGFEPHRDYRRAAPILGDADPQACNVPIPLGGPKGKPMFFAGPYDNVAKIMGTLERAVGPDGYTFMMPLEGIGDTDAFLDL
ncbi:MAG: hypothetical protein GXP41_09905 [Chloroflexi bacterium]|nr:hypothetical protein [Chloroflexota bacterium]